MNSATSNKVEDQRLKLAEAIYEAGRQSRAPWDVAFGLDKDLALQQADAALAVIGADQSGEVVEVFDFLGPEWKQAIADGSVDWPDLIERLERALDKAQSEAVAEKS